MFELFPLVGGVDLVEVCHQGLALPVHSLAPFLFSLYSVFAVEDVMSQLSVPCLLPHYGH